MDANNNKTLVYWFFHHNHGSSIDYAHSYEPKDKPHDMTKLKWSFTPQMPENKPVFTAFFQLEERNPNNYYVLEFTADFGGIRESYGTNYFNGHLPHQVFLSLYTYIKLTLDRASVHSNPSENEVYFYRKVLEYIEKFELPSPSNPSESYRLSRIAQETKQTIEKMSESTDGTKEESASVTANIEKKEFLLHVGDKVTIGKVVTPKHTLDLPFDYLDEIRQDQVFDKLLNGKIMYITDNLVQIKIYNFYEMQDVIIPIPREKAVDAIGKGLWIDN